MLPPNHARALHEVVDVLERLNVPYHLTGGVAGNLYGSSWPPRDIDIDVPGAALPALAAAFGEAVIAPAARCTDEEFDIVVLQVMLHGVLIELVQLEEHYLRVGGRWEPSGSDPEHCSYVAWEGRTLRVQPLEAIIAYKRRLGRAADVADLERVLARRG